MQISLRSLFGFAFSVPAYTLLFLWPLNLGITIFADCGPIPDSTHRNSEPLLHYNFMLAVFSAESVWSLLTLVCVSASSLFSVYLASDIRPASLGDWQPILLHLFFISAFAFLNLVTFAIVSLVA